MAALNCCSLDLHPVPGSGFTVLGMDDLMSTDSCTLPTAERPLRLAEFDALFASSARSVSRDVDGVRIRLAGSGGLREHVRGLTDRETACCSFFAFKIEGLDDDLTLHIVVPVERRENLEALADRAEALIT
jgi:hypothetical protein